MSSAEIGSTQLGHRLSQLREQAGIKQAELARNVTWSPAQLSRMEAGERPISDDELQTLLAAIGTEDAAQLSELVQRQWKILTRPPLDHPDQAILWQAERTSSSLTELAEQPHTSPPFARRLNEYIEEINRLAARIQNRSHQIAFVGSIGIGKSTAICRAAGLEVTDSKGQRLPVLETGGGGVTLCEVQLSTGPGYGIVVEPRSQEAIRVDVADFADQLLRSSKPDDDHVQSEETARAVPREIERAIRNMASLRPTRSKGADGKTVRTDPAKDLAFRLASRRELIVEILTRMELHRRDKRDDWFDPSLADDPLTWLKTSFEQVNNGRHDNFSLPARIELIVPFLVDFGDLSIDIIDTRGIDQLIARADLEAHLEDPHTISIFCSGFNDAPEQSVHHLLQRARDIGNVQIETHSALLVLPRPAEAMAMKDESGIQAETTEEGCDLKEEQIRVALTPYDLEPMPVGFFNALEDDPAKLRALLEELVRRARDKFQSSLEDVLANADVLLMNVEREQVHEVQREAGRHITSWVGLHREPAQPTGHVHDSLLAEIASAHAATVHAAVRREGEWQSLSYSHQLGHGARRVAVSALHEAHVKFRDMCETLADSMPEAGELLEQASRLMTHAYEELLRKTQLAGVTLYGEKLAQESQLWQECETEWGQGSGYRDRVARRNRDWFEAQPRLDLEAELRTVLEREWAEVLERVRRTFETD